MNWTKIDTNFYHNPKIRLAGRDARDVYLFVLLMNAQLNADGEIPARYADPTYLSSELQCSVDQAIGGLKHCETFQLLHVTGVTITINGWDSSWRVKTSTDRVAKHRQKKKDEKSEENQPITEDETLRNVTSVTRNKCNASEESRVEESRVDKVTSPPAPTFDFESVYQRYPKKAGKQSGMKGCVRLIKTSDEFVNLRIAVSEMGKAWEGKPKTYCPGWGPFINQQRYLDEDLPFPSSDSTPGGSAPKIKDLT